MSLQSDSHSFVGHALKSSLPLRLWESCGSIACCRKWKEPDGGFQLLFSPYVMLAAPPLDPQSDIRGNVWAMGSNLSFVASLASSISLLCNLTLNIANQMTKGIKLVFLCVFFMASSSRSISTCKTKEITGLSHRFLIYMENIYVYIHLCMYIYVCVYKERERERKNARCKDTLCSSLCY